MKWDTPRPHPRTPVVFATLRQLVSRAFLYLDRIWTCTQPTLSHSDGTERRARLITLCGRCLVHREIHGVTGALLLQMLMELCMRATSLIELIEPAIWTLIALGFAGCGGSTEGPSADPSLHAIEATAPSAPSVLPADVLMTWAEATYPWYFSPPRAPSAHSGEYEYRYYASTGNYLGVAGQGIFVKGPVLTGGEIRGVGSLSDYECDALPEVCWPGSEVIPIMQAPMHAATDASRAYVIRTESELATMWQQVYGANAPALPQIDFTSNAVIGGTTTVYSPCEYLQVKRILRQAGTYRVVWGIGYIGEACAAVYEPRAADAFVLLPQPVADVQFVQVPGRDCAAPLPIIGRFEPLLHVYFPDAADYLFTYKKGVDAVAETARLVSMYGLRVTNVFESFGGVAADIPATALPGMRCETTIAYIEHDGLVYAGATAYK